MKAIAKMSRLELAAFISSELHKRKIDVVLSGGSCVSIYSNDEYVSMDLDFVNTGFAKRSDIKDAMVALGFAERNRYFYHAETEFLVEFPPGPLGVGNEPVKQIEQISATTGVLKIISVTDCVKDRLAWYYHNNDTECLEQALLVVKFNDVDMLEIERWSIAEDMQKKFVGIKKRLKKS